MIPRETIIVKLYLLTVPYLFKCFIHQDCTQTFNKLSGEYISLYFFACGTKHLWYCNNNYRLQKMQTALPGDLEEVQSGNPATSRNDWRLLGSRWWGQTDSSLCSGTDQPVARLASLEIGSICFSDWAPPAHCMAISTYFSYLTKLTFQYSV